MKNNLQNSNSLIDKKIDWKVIQQVMKEKFGKDIFESWLKKIELVDEFRNYLLISVSTRFIRDWITSRYLDQILQIIKNHKKDLIRIEFKIVEQKITDHQKIESILSSENKNENVSFLKDSYLQYNRIDPNKRFENFQRKLVMNFHLGILNCFDIRERKMFMEFVSESF